MRIALVADIHGNDIALEAVLADIDDRGVDQIACLGDVATLGPNPRAVLERVAERADITIMGNHDAYLGDPSLVAGYTDAPIIHDAVAWCREELESKHFEIAAKFEATRRLELCESHSLLLFHGSPRSDCEFLYDVTPAEILDEALAGHAATHYAGGHTHLPLLRQHGDAVLINPGSVGLAFRDRPRGGPPTVVPHADYALATHEAGRVVIEHIRLALPSTALAAAADIEGFPLREQLVAAYTCSIG